MKTWIQLVCMACGSTARVTGDVQPCGDHFHVRADPQLLDGWSNSHLQPVARVCWPPTQEPC